MDLVELLPVDFTGSNAWLSNLPSPNAQTGGEIIDVGAFEAVPKDIFPQ